MLVPENCHPYVVEGVVAVLFNPPYHPVGGLVFVVAAMYDKYLKRNVTDEVIPLNTDGIGISLG